MILYNTPISTAAYRVRIALNYKSLPHTLVNIDLESRQQRSETFKQINPHCRVPTLDVNGFKFGQSMAILEYLEENYPSPALLPKDTMERAWVRYLAQIIVSDMHPVMNNSSVAHYLKTQENFTEEQIKQWRHTWLKQGFDALETNLNNNPERIFCVGDQPTFADVCLIPQVYNANKYGFSMDAYPTLMHIYQHCIKLNSFIQASPENNQLQSSEQCLSVGDRQKRLVI